MPVVAVRQAAYEEVRGVIEELVPRFLADVRGKTVLLKPNMLAPFPPDKAITTHPAVVRALYEHLRSRGADVRVGDNPGVTGYGSNERVARATGILDVVGKGFVNLGAEVDQVEFGPARGASPLDRPATGGSDRNSSGNPGAGRDSRILVSRFALTADIVISVPKFKTHSLTVLTGAVKNMYGIVAGGDKARLHTRGPSPDAFGDIVAAVYGVRPPDLTVMDAVVGLEGNGPSAGRPRPLGCIVVGPDAVAVDASMARAVGVDPSSVPHLRSAARRGLGVIAEEEIRVDGEFPVIEGFRLPGTFHRSRFVSRIINGVAFRMLTRPKLKIDEGRCSACAVCEAGCPVGAIHVDGDCAVVDNERCAHCYLCHEVCPESAVKITGLLGRVTARGGAG